MWKAEDFCLQKKIIGLIIGPCLIIAQRQQIAQKGFGGKFPVGQLSCYCDFCYRNSVTSMWQESLEKQVGRVHYGIFQFIAILRKRLLK